MVTIVALIVDGKYKMGYEAIYWGTVILDILSLAAMTAIFA